MRYIYGYTSGNFMRVSTKDKILKVSLEEFNKQSLLKTSLRGLASQLDISDGNLRYHYQTKKDIVVALIHEYQEKHNRLFEEENALDIKSSFRLLYRLFELIYAYRFILLEKKYIQLYHPETSIYYSNMRSYVEKLFDSIVNSLSKQDALEKDIEPVQMGRLREQFIIIYENWINSAGDAEEDIENYTRICFSLLVPYIEKHLKLVI